MGIEAASKEEEVAEEVTEEAVEEVAEEAAATEEAAEVAEAAPEAEAEAVEEVAEEAAEEANGKEEVAEEEPAAPAPTTLAGLIESIEGKDEESLTDFEKSVKQRKRRAEKFGMEFKLSDSEMANLRTARF